MADLLLMLLGLMACAFTAVVLPLLLLRARDRRQDRQLAQEQKRRDALDAYLKEVDQAKTPAELERLALRERERQRKWDGSF